MDFSASTVWWVAAGAAVAAELATGTFYLLMIALGLVAGALAAYFGFAASWQVIGAALIGGGATALWHWKRMSHPRPQPVSTNRDANLDIGERVNAVAWQADRTARVQYRGSTWSARLAPEVIPLAGEHVVVAVEGNWLVLAPALPR